MLNGYFCDPLIAFLGFATSSSLLKMILVCMEGTKDFCCFFAPCSVDSHDSDGFGEPHDPHTLGVAHMGILVKFLPPENPRETPKVPTETYPKNINGLMKTEAFSCQSLLGSQGETST